MRSVLKYTTIALSATLLVSCGGKDEKESEAKISPEVVNNPASATASESDPEAIPVFSFETDNHEFGEIKEGEVVSFAFKFKNTGKAPLVISSASASCGCTIPKYTKTPVQPGEEGVIDVTFDSTGKSGMVSKTVTVIANTIPNTKVLTISADIHSSKEKS